MVLSINSALRAAIATRSFAIDGDVVVDGRKLTKDQASHLLMTIGLLWFNGKALKGHEFARFSGESLEWPSIDVARKGDIRFLTIDRLPENHCSNTACYHCDADNRCVDIFLPAKTYDELIKNINAS